MNKGYLLVCATAVISGISIFMNKWAVSGLNPYAFTWSKNIAVALMLVSMIFLMNELKDIRSLTKKQWMQLAAIGFVGGSIPFLLFFKGLQLTSAATAAFIHKSMFLFVVVFAYFFLKEKIDKRFLIGAAALLAGNFFLLNSTIISFDLGAALILGATLLWAVENTISKHVLKEINARIVAFGRMFFGSLFILAFLLFTGEITTITAITMPQLYWIIFTALLLLAYVATWYEGLRTIPVSHATCVLLIGSVITTALQFIFLGNPITLAQGIGMTLIVGGLVSVLKIKLPSPHEWH